MLVVTGHAGSPGVERLRMKETLDDWSDDGRRTSRATRDIAYAALLLASDEARFVNGENLDVDGGATVILG